jgi:ABC-type antimicrobial peptide transport system permease subunit
MMVRQVIGRTVRLAAIGSAAGALVLTVAPAFNPVLALGEGSRLFGPAIAASIVVAIATIATLLPARRAGSADPAELLRN